MIVSIGLTLVDPLAAVDVNVPGIIETLVAPLVTHLNVLLCPFVMLDGLAVNELMVGFVAARATPFRPTQASRLNKGKNALPHRSTTVSSSASPNCSFTAADIFISHLVAVNPRAAQSYITLTDLNLAAYTLCSGRPGSRKLAHRNGTPFR